MTITHRFITTNGIKMHIAEAGQGPLVVLAHGFPETWYSWRGQLMALAEAGFHAVAPDMRGYGRTEQPAAIEQYSIFHLVGDMVGLLDELKVLTAVIVGHDWGAPVAWHCALFRPDRFRAVAGMSVPFFPRTSVKPSSVMPANDDAVFYQLYFQEPGIAEVELEHDTHQTIRRIQLLWSGDGIDHSAEALTMVPRKGGFLEGKPLAATHPPWLTEADISHYASEFKRTGFRGALNWYRNIDRNWEYSAPWKGATIGVPALYMIGDRDLLMKFHGMDKLLPNLERIVPRLTDKIILPGCGHWIQNERAAELNAALIRFLRALN